MIALISPAKSLDYASPLPDLPFTQPRLEDDAAKLAKHAAKLGAGKLEKLMHISEKLATLNAERFSTFDDAEQRAAIYAFAGDVYQGFEASTLDEPAMLFAQNHLRILSGLYGLLRPLDQIRPYRLEMGTKWAPGKTEMLYKWWDKRISNLLAEDMAEEGTAWIINLASKEYWQAVAQHPPAKAKIITIDFKDHGPKGLRFNSFAAKRARGMMARYMCEHQIAEPDGLKVFDSDGYAYDASASTASQWLFVRER